MNPMHLLTVSKSLMDIKDATGRYRMAEGNLLPKFNATARAVSPAATAKSEPIKRAMKPGIEVQSTGEPEAKSKKFPLTSVPAQVRKVLSKGGLFARAVCAKAFLPVSGALEKIKPLAFWKSRPTRAKSERIKPIKSAVQGELLLDKVKVIRNDLSETDLEIVPVTNLEQPKMPEPVPALVTASETTKTSWGRLTSRIFGSGQTPF